jgi:hypothetical protein
VCVCLFVCKLVVSDMQDKPTLLPDTHRLLKNCMNKTSEVSFIMT